MLELPKLGTYSHKVYNYYTRDFQNNITADKLLNLVLDSAGEHANERGFGKDAFTHKGVTWVLSRVHLDLHASLDHLDTLYIDTWIDLIKSAFSIRKFNIHDGKGNILGSAATLWSIIDIQTRKLQAITKILPSFDIQLEHECKTGTPEKYQITDYEVVDTLKARYTDIDYNQHVNSNRYVVWAINTFPLAHFHTQKLQSLGVNFLAEVLYDDIVEIRRSLQDGFYYFELYNLSRKEVACRIKLHFASQI